MDAEETEFSRNFKKTADPKMIAHIQNLYNSEGYDLSAEKTMVGLKEFVRGHIEDLTLQIRDARLEHRKKSETNLQFANKLFLVAKKNKVEVLRRKFAHVMRIKTYLQSYEMRREREESKSVN